VRTLLVAAASAVGLYDTSAIFIRETPAVAISGQHRIAADEFGRGARVTQLFRMTAGALSAIEVGFATDRPLTVFVHAVVSETDEFGEHGRVVSDKMLTFKNVSGVSWRRLRVARLGDSYSRWYTLTLQLDDASVVGAILRRESGAERPRVALVMSRDNVFGGGALWIGDRRQIGSLSMRAFSDRRTAFQRFRADVAPSLPLVLQSAAAEVAIVILYHAALLIVVCALLIGFNPTVHVKAANV
jgi:hypothetical protein